MRSGDPNELVQLDLVFHDETYMITDPMTREMANLSMRLFGEQAIPVLGKRVVWAIIVPIVPDGAKLDLT